MAKILIAEDDKDLNRLVSITLRNNGFDVESCFDGVQALDAFSKSRFDALLTDVMMPNMDGFDLAQNVRDIDKNVPVIFMTAKDDKQSKMLGYALEIDDYVTKPFDVDLLVLKLKAILRRAKIKNDKELVVGNFCMNQEERVATIDGNEINLTVREFDLLFKLLSYPKKTFTRTQLMDEFWDVDTQTSTRTVDVYMTKLRAKLSECNSFEIQTVHGLGYKAVIK